MSIITRDICESVLKSKLASDGFEVESFEEHRCSDDVIGFQGKQSLLKITAKLLINNNRECFQFFVKRDLRDDGSTFFCYLSRSRVFFKEHEFMGKVLADVERYFIRDVTPKCYYSEIDKFVIMEDLSEQGYKLSQRQYLDFQHAKVALETFADFHAAFICFEHFQNTKFIEKYKEINFESLIFLDVTGQGSFAAIDKGLRTLFDQYFQHLPKYIRHGTMDRLSNRLIELVKPSTQYRNCILHGDPRGNNILFGYDEANRPISAKLVDFQTVRYAPPAQEVVEFLYIAMTTADRIEYQERLKDAYYTRLADTLTLKQVDINRILTKEEFTDSCQLYEDFGMGSRLMYWYITQLPPEYQLAISQNEKDLLAIMCFGNCKYPLQAFKEDETYRKVMTELFECALERFGK